MTDKLPPNLLALFAPRPPLKYIVPQDYAPEARSTGPIDGVAAFLPALKEEPHPYTPTESWLQRKDRLRQEKLDYAKWLEKDGLSLFKPEEDPNIKGDALKTLFVGRLRYGVTSDELRAEFGRFGPIRKIRVVENVKAPENKVKKRQRGYAFIEFEREGDMKAAYKETDGMRVRDRKIIVDVERGRTVKDWRPMRLGGGLGGRGYTKLAAVRPMGYGAPYGGGFRGGFGGDRGGFRGGFRGGRGGFGDRGGRGGGGGYGGGRGGYGGSSSYGGGPPSGPRGPGGYGSGSGSGGGGGGYGGDRSYGRSRYDDGPGGGSNREPLGHRDDRDRDRKRPYDGGGGYDESRTRRRY